MLTTRTYFSVQLRQGNSNPVGGVGKVQGAPEFQANNVKNKNFSVTVKIRTSGYQTLECFIATLQT